MKSLLASFIFSLFLCPFSFSQTSTDNIEVFECYAQPLSDQEQEYMEGSESYNLGFKLLKTRLYSLDSVRVGDYVYTIKLGQAVERSIRDTDGILISRARTFHLYSHNGGTFYLADRRKAITDSSIGQYAGILYYKMKFGNEPERFAFEFEISQHKKP